MTELNDTVGLILQQKSGKIWSITPDTSVFDALTLMAEKNIGALPVVADGVLVGVLSERDYARKVILLGRSSKETEVAEIMLAPPVTVTASATIGDCMQIITSSRIRHLPVMEGRRLAGIVSIGDLVNWIIHRQAETIQQLHAYISGSYPA
jgi:CBS domain-containing protein